MNRINSSVKLSLNPNSLIIVVVEIGLACSFTADLARECSGPSKGDFLSGASFQVGPVQGDQGVVSADFKVVN